MFVKTLKVYNKAEYRYLQSTVTEAKALGYLLRCISRKYKDKKVTIYSDSRDLVKNINYGGKTEQHKIVGKVVDTYREIHDKENVKVKWTSRSNNIFVDYLTRYKYVVEKIKFTKVKLTKNLIDYKEVDAKLIYKLKFEKNGIKQQSFLLKNLDDTYTISIRSRGFSDYYNLDNLKDLDIKTKIMLDSSKNIMFNNNKIGSNANIVEYINRNCLTIIILYDIIDIIKHRRFNQ